MTDSPTLPPVPVSELPPGAEKIIEALGTAIANASPPGTPVSVMALPTAGEFNGEFDLQIIYNKTTYALNVALPKTQQDPYTFRLTTTPKKADGTDGPAQDLLSFTYTASGAWSLTAGLPMKPTIGSVTIQKLQLTLGQTPKPKPDQHDENGQHDHNAEPEQEQ